jgi:hypothetical protein
LPRSDLSPVRSWVLDRGYTDFYEKAHSVKADVAAPSWSNPTTYALRAMLLSALLGEPTLRWLDAYDVRSVLVRALLRRCNLPIGLYSLADRPSPYAQSPLEIRSDQRQAVASATLPQGRCCALLGSSPPLCSFAASSCFSSLFKLPPALGADASCRVAHRSLLLPTTGGAKAHTVLLATATTARFLAFLAPRWAIFSPWRRRSESEPKGPRM